MNTNFFTRCKALFIGGEGEMKRYNIIIELVLVYKYYSVANNDTDRYIFIMTLSSCPFFFLIIMKN